MLPASLNLLYWSIRGEVACIEHTPDPDDPRWTIEAWAPVPVSSSNIQGSRYQCQHRAADGRALVHPYVGPAH